MHLKRVGEAPDCDNPPPPPRGPAAPSGFELSPPPGIDITAQPAPPPPDKRSCHVHPIYGDGEYGQQPVPTAMPSGAGSTEDPDRKICGHPACDWQGQWWAKQHALQFGLGVSFR